MIDLKNCFKRGIKNIRKAIYTQKERMSSFVKRIVEQKEQIGYYAVLATVLIALGAAAYDYRSKQNNPVDKDADMIKDSGIHVQAQPDPAFSQAETKAGFVLPVYGKIVQGYSENELTWSTTLQLWQTHPAVDIAASMGEAVLACADGVVTEAFSDALFGNTIVIDHGDGVVLHYRSLNTIELVNIGDEIKRGDVISAVGGCNAEAEFGGHVHIECRRDGKTVNFLDLLDESEYQNLRE